MTLAQAPRKLVIDPRRYLHMIHGEAGVGKTHFGWQMPGHYFMLTEVGDQGVEVFGEPIFNWGGFTTKCEEIVVAKEGGFENQREIKVIVIDVLERLFLYGGEYVCKKYAFPEKGVLHKYDRIEDVPFGKGYARVCEIILSAVNRLMLEGLGVFLISHTKERPVKWQGQELSHYGPNLSPTSAQTFVDACGAVGYFYIDQKVDKDEQGNVTSVETGRWMQWQPTHLKVAKHKLDLPERLPLCKNTGYTDYLKAFQEAVEKRQQEIRQGQEQPNVNTG